jgi:hypothetical protein
MGMRWAALFLPVALLAADPYTAFERKHWAYQKVRRTEPPRIASPWVRTPVDAFILARLRKEGLTPAQRASARTLVRRLHLDVTGLPPSPEAVEQFAASPTRAAYEELVDALLASPQYAERMAQHWLDVVRFAETDGFEYDTHRPDAWRYRDYVVKSFAEDKPYDRFVREQLAGDEIDQTSEDLRVAAGFQRLGALRKNAGNQEVASSRNEVLTEMTNIVGSAFLGLTLGCARCHDHKFDAIRQKDYYRVQAYFAATHDKDVPLASETQQAEWKKRSGEINERIKKLQAEMKGLDGPALMEKKKEMERLEWQLPEPLPGLFTVADDPAKMTPVHVLARGEWTKKGEAVGMRPPGVLLPPDFPEADPAKSAHPRRELAEWLTSPDHPLTARVMVNRIWQMHFGRGIAATANDFGRMGARPTHPELLDWLAAEFVAGGWRMKPIHRAILLSSAYQQSSIAGPLATKKDPQNKLWSRFERRRLDAEQIRDSMLAVAGALNPKRGGPSVMVPVEEEVRQALYKPSQWKVTADESEHNRRSLYLIVKRNLRLPFLEVFDQPDRSVSCARRESSTHAPQALELLNGDFSNRMARALAARLDRECGGDRRKIVDRAFRLAAGRAPNPREMAASLRHLAGQPLSEFALAVLNLNAFLYVN